MYWFISRYHPYLEELHRSSYNRAYLKECEAMEIDLKNKIAKAQEFDIKECYNLDQISDENSIEEDDDSLNEVPISQGTSSHPSYKPGGVSSNTSNVNGSKGVFNRKIVLFKSYIRILDILASLLIMIGTILSQIENELYYDKNIYSRVCATVIMNYIYNSQGNSTSWEQIFDESNVNLTALTEIAGISLPTSSINYAMNVKEMDDLYGNTQNTINENRKFIYGTFTQIKNKDILIAYNITPSLFNYTPSETDYEHILVPLTIDEYNKSLRLSILLTSILAGGLLFLSRYLEHMREYIFKKEIETPFYKSEYSFYFLVELALVMIIQYPGMNSYIIFTQLGSTMCLPYSSVLGAMSIFRFIFIVKIFKSLSIWNSNLAEKKCEKYSCTADTIFAFKALQKENPFVTLFIIFVLTCVCFGFSLRHFELHYWETQKDLSQNWRYHWNAMWCVFVSMTTVGYGDFYPKTHLGRVIIILACIVGIYFVSMMMVFMTQKSILTESEQKAYKLITRLKLRAELKDIHANIIFHFFQMIMLQNMTHNKILSQKDFQIKHSYQKRCLISWIDEKKVKDRAIRTFEVIPTKEQLFDICERIDTDIKEINREIYSLQLINNSISGYTDSQVIMMKYLKKNVIATKLLYDLIDKKPQLFGMLSKYDKSILEEFGKYKRKSLATYLSTKYEGKLTLEKKKANNDEKSRDSKDTLKNPLLQQKINNTASNLHHRGLSHVMSNTNNCNSSADSKGNKNIPQLNLDEIDGDQRRRTNPNQFDDNIYNALAGMGTPQLDSDDESDDQYGEELSKYNVTADEFKNHFNSLFFNQSDISKRTNTKNTERTIITLKSMKDQHKKLETVIMLKRSCKNLKKKVMSAKNVNHDLGI